MNQRRYSGSSYSGLDGSGVGIAVLDSGIMANHQNFANASGITRVQRAVDLQKVGDAVAAGVKDWTLGIDSTGDMTPNGATQTTYQSKIANEGVDKVDLYGHGTHVASVAAGRGAYQALDSSGIAPGAKLFDIKVLDANGFGQVSDVIAGIDWVIYNARSLNIRVMNLSLAADSTETWQTDPLARAVRSATAAGITVVVAGGNFGEAPKSNGPPGAPGAPGAERYGSISSPGHEPSIITVGSANTKDTVVRSDDTVNNFSSRGPTRGVYVDAAVEQQFDNLLKPDLVAPGNRVLGALATDKKGGKVNYLSTTYPALQRGSVDKNNALRTLMALSGTSIAAPAVAGAAAVLLQANPGLTPPLIKAILQYTAQPIAGANLLQQGAGLLNLDGAVKLAQALRNDIRSAVEAGSITAGAGLLANGKTLPAATSTLNGQAFNWV